MIAIPVFKRLRQEKYLEFKAKLNYIVEFQANLDYRVTFYLKDLNK